MAAHWLPIHKHRVHSTEHSHACDIVGSFSNSPPPLVASKSLKIYEPNTTPDFDGLGQAWDVHSVVLQTHTIECGRVNAPDAVFKLYGETFVASRPGTPKRCACPHELAQIIRTRKGAFSRPTRGRS